MCVSPCSDFLAIATAAGMLAIVLWGRWYGPKEKKCRCPTTEKCSHKPKEKK